MEFPVKKLPVTELIDRYLHAVKFWLPRKQKNDIIAELSEDLRSQIEEKESALGREIEVADVELILKRCGSPMAVAQRYLPQRSLIGPALFPIYRMVIRSLIFYFLLPWLLLWLGITIFSPDFRADHPGMALLASLDPWWLACTYSLFFNTLIFALLDRSQARSQIVDDWNPRSLPAIRDPNRIRRSESIFDLTFSVAGLALWFEIGAFHRVFHFFGLTATLSPRWPYFFWGLTAVSIGGIALACLNVASPRWTRLSATLRLGLDFYSWGLIYYLLRANLLQSLTGADVSSPAATKFINSLNPWIASYAIWVMAIGLVAVAFDIRRILRVASAA